MVVHQVVMAVAQAIVPLHVLELLLMDVVDVLQAVLLVALQAVLVRVVDVLQVVLIAALQTALAHVGGAGEDVGIVTKEKEFLINNRKNVTNS